MARSFSVMGFTEAELGFVMAALFAALSFVAMAQNENLTQQALAADVSRSSLASIKAERDSLRRALATLRDSIQKRSNLTPYCYEKGEPRGNIAEMMVASDDAYVVGGDTLTYANVVDRLANKIARSSQLGCMYQVRALPVQGVDATVHSRAVIRLKRYFRVSEQ